MTRSGQRSVELHLGGRCGLSCAPCDCRARPAEPAAVDATLRGGGGRVLLRGGGGEPGALASVVARARSEGFSEIVLRTSAVAYGKPEAAASLVTMGVSGVLVPLFSHVAQVHDRIAGRPSALAHALVGMRALAALGLRVEIEVPLLPPRIQDLCAVVELAHRAVPDLASARFFVPAGSMPRALAPPPWSASQLAAAIRRARELGVSVGLRGMDAVPLCALRGEADLHDAHRFNPRAKASRAPGATFVAACEGCAARRQCPGVAQAYLEANGEADIVPYAKRPLKMYAQRNGAVRVWNDEQRRAASQATMLVLRPTVNCNQDCTFCSANETTGNVWSEPGAMMRQIARAARRGVTWLSFSGGEPTLSRDLASFIAVAKRCGIRDIEIVTNAVLLDSERRVNELRAAGLSQAFVSLHAHEEGLSQLATQKVGDFPRTVRAVKLMIEAGIATGLNHVITAKNFRYLPRFVEFAHRELGGRTMISFALVTPQYKALEDLEQMPRISDVMPYLRRALRLALDLGQPFTVGSRQGIPPCFLKELAGWSDLMKHAHEAKSEDAPQKVRSPRCDACRYTNLCVGVWRPYAERYGTDEIEPVVGPAFTDAQVSDIQRSLPLGAWSFQRSFEQVPALLRDRVNEAAWPPAEPEIAPAPARLHLPVLLKRTRPLRLAMIGSGPRARKLAADAAHVRGLSIDAVASPHAPDADLREIGSCPAYRDAASAVSEIRPEAVIIAASTRAHHALALLAIRERVPMLLEKPLAQTDEQAEELVRLVERDGVLAMPAHNVVFSDGLERLWARGPAASIAYVRKVPSGAAAAPRMWSRASLYETLYHAVALVVHAAGHGFTSAQRPLFKGDTRPERLAVTLVSDAARAELSLDYAATIDEISLAVGPADAPPAMTWRRLGRETTVSSGSRDEVVPSTGSDTERMLTRFRDAVLGEAEFGVTFAEGLAVMRATRLVVDALAAAGAPFDRPDAPKHVASKALSRF